MSAAWTKPFRLGELGKNAMTVQLEPDAAQRAAIAGDLGLVGLSELTAELTLRPWMDGVEITGGFQSVVEQICAVSLDVFEHPVGGEIALRAVPAGSAHATDPAGGDIEHDLGAPDPPDVLESDTLDLAAYVVEHLALEIDPFARKPGVAFDYSPPDEMKSPFAVLGKLKGDGA